MDQEHKRHLNYRDGQGDERCENCAYSRRRLFGTVCDLVRQTVNPNAVCDLLTIRTPGVASVRREPTPGEIDARKRMEPYIHNPNYTYGGAIGYTDYSNDRAASGEGLDE